MGLVIIFILIFIGVYFLEAILRMVQRGESNPQHLDFIDAFNVLVIAYFLTMLAGGML